MEWARWIGIGVRGVEGPPWGVRHQRGVSRWMRCWRGTRAWAAGPFSWFMGELQHQQRSYHVIGRQPDRRRSSAVGQMSQPTSGSAINHNMITPCCTYENSLPDTRCLRRYHRYAAQMMRTRSRGKPYEPGDGGGASASASASESPARGSLCSLGMLIGSEKGTGVLS